MINNSTVDEHKNFKPGYRLAFKVYVIYEAVGCDMLPDSFIFVTVSSLSIVIKRAMHTVNARKTRTHIASFN